MSSASVVVLPSGLALELALSPPSASPDVGHNKLAVLLHPWSWLGGRMSDPVLHTFLRPLQARGFHVIRYNSRGVGRSSGWASLTGAPEAKDLQEVVQWGLTNVPDVQHVLILGYSHGSLIASQYQHLPSIRTSHILLSYPLGPRAFLTCFRSRAYDQALTALLENPNADVLVLFGDSDEFTGIESYERWAAQLKQGTGGEGSRLRVDCVQGATHFWGRDESEEMLTIVGHWLDRDLS
ncbi:hypothetical protein M0805_007858 [Coniferiporia weirii]|nr:hypothetical protein M0805_007858 [Coniferiporia weirii]